MKPVDSNSIRSVGPDNHRGLSEDASIKTTFSNNRASAGNSAGPSANGCPPAGALDIPPGAFKPSDHHYPVLSKAETSVEPDREFILVAAWNGSGEGVVRAHHLARFNAECGGDEHVLGQVMRDIDVNIKSGIAHQGQLAALLENTERYDTIQRNSEPWTLWDRARFVVLLVVSLVFLAVDVNSTALTLMHSGWDSFRNHYWVSAFFNLSIIIGGVCIVELINSWLQSECARRWYALGIAGGAAVSLGFALPTFAATYARMTTDPIALMTGEAVVGQVPDAARTFLFQILTGNLVAGAMWLTAALLIERHRRSSRAENPAWTQVKADLDAMQELLSKERKRLGLAQAEIARIAAKREQLLSCATQYYKLAADQAAQAKRHEDRQSEFLRNKPTIKKGGGGSPILPLLALALPLNGLADATTPNPRPTHYVLAVGSGLSKRIGTSVFKASLDLLLNRATAGDHVEFIAAPDMVRLALVTVPAGSARDRANSPEFAGKFGALKKSLLESPPADPTMAGQLRLPELLDYVARSRSQGEPLVAILVGSPLFMSPYPLEKAFNMDAALIPGDGMVAASVSASIFGTKERKGQLQGTVIHWCTVDDRWVVSEMHRQGVDRFWSLFCAEQGAVLSSFNSDLGAVFDRAMRGEHRPVIIATLDPNDHGLSMHGPTAFLRRATETPPAPPVVAPAEPKLVPAGPPPEPASSRTATQPAPPAAARPLPVPPPVSATAPVKDSPPPVPTIRPTVSNPTVTSTATQSPAQTQNVAQPVPVIPEIPRAAVGDLGIAAIWHTTDGNADADIDIYVKSSPDRPEAFWRQPYSTGVRLFRDVRHAVSAEPGRNWKLSWEYAEVKSATLTNVSVWLNVYHARGPVTGVVRIQWQGQTFDQPFRFAVECGNGGRDDGLAARRRSKYWREVRLTDFFPASFSLNAKEGK